MEKWIAQKRAEIAKEKAEIGGDKENNVPPTVTSKSQPPTQINRGSVGQPVQSNEPLIFKLGDDYQLRKESGTPFLSQKLFMRYKLCGINYVIIDKLFFGMFISPFENIKLFSSEHMIF